jgi:TonB family protein
MKKFIFVLFLVCTSFLFSQEKDSLKSKDLIDFEFVEEMAEFPGGEIKMMQWINRQVHYPAMAIENGIQGKVFIECIIDTAGNVKNVKVIKGVHPLLDNEAKRVIKKLPRFKPATHKGRVVPIRYNIPIVFKLG